MLLLILVITYNNKDMAYTGSGVLEVTYNNPQIGQGTLFCKDGEGYTIDLGGKRSADDTAMVTTSGTRINQMSVVCSKFELPPIAWDKTAKDELAILKKLAGAMVGTTWTVTCIDGAIYQMQNGYPAGDIAGEGYDGTIPLTLVGDADAERIS